MTFTEAFEKIKKEFKTTDATAVTDNFAIQVNFTDEDCSGAFYIAVDNGAVYVEPYDYYDRRALLAADFKVLKDIFTGKVSVSDALENGTAYVEGDVESISVITGTIKKPVRKTTTKKAVKKVEVKGEPEKKKTTKKVVKKVEEKAEPEKKKAAKK